ncbi:MAG: glutamine-hydrolyzing carbamoyl-phosphate synthase small subunit [Pseudothermotoga sp.]
MKKALLVLEDGSHFYGESFASDGEAFGELVFNTGMTGYQEILTDPSYKGQIVVMSYPEIGIYGINYEDVESDTIKVAGFIVYSSVKEPSNYRARKSLADYLKEHGVVAVEGIDTRMLIKRIREKGVIKGAISTQDLNVESLLAKLKKQQELDSLDLVKEVSTDKVIESQSDSNWRLALIDCGCKRGIIRELEKLKASVIVVPYTIDFEKLRNFKVHGVIISNGPGNPVVLERTISLVKDILRYKMPVAGICLGHQLMSLAIGARTYKMKFGHRGINHPVKDLEREKILITTHNHGFAVEPESIGIKGITNKEQDPRFIFENIDKFKNLVGTSPEGYRLKITHISLNDGTVEGIRLLDFPAFSVQYHPEASPGPHDAKEFFKDFMNLVFSR